MIDRWLAFCERKAVVLLNKFAPPEFEPSMVQVEAFVDQATNASPATEIP